MVLHGTNHCLVNQRIYPDPTKKGSSHWLTEVHRSFEREDRHVHMCVQSQICSTSIVRRNMRRLDAECRRWRKT